MDEPQTPVRWTISFVFSQAALQAFWTYGFPPLFGATTAVFGVVEKQPIMWVMATSAFAFAMMSFGLLSFDHWRLSRSPEHKIIYVRLIVSRVDGPPQAASLGFAMRSLANFPIEVSLTKLSTSLASRIPRPQIALPRKLTVDARSDFYFMDSVIEIVGISDAVMEGSLEYELTYGRPGGRKYTVSNAQSAFVPLDPKEQFTFSAKNEQPSATNR